MSYKVFIPTAGLGSRLGTRTKHLNKALVSVGGKPAISHIIEKFDESIRLVLALGHKGEQVREVLSILYPRRSFDFVDVDLFEGPGSGLGYSLSKCKAELQCPFIFVSCDTIVGEQIPVPDYNWMGHSESRDTKQYRAVRVENGLVTEICEKGAPGSVFPYIGLAGIYDFESFWSGMESASPHEMIAMGEAPGLRALVSKGVRAHLFTWFDTGGIEGLEATALAFRKKDDPIILEKEEESIWFLENEVAKFSTDRDFISNRVKRAKILEGYCPQVIRSSRNVYVYQKAEGRVVSDVVTIPLFEDLLRFCGTFWKISSPLADLEQDRFKVSCMEFYRDKTLKRLKLFFDRCHRTDLPQRINEIEVPSMNEILSQVDWAQLSDGWAGNFHGDLHFENILYSQAQHRFWFLDWRQEFGGSLSIGDVYYDLAKLRHGLIINHDLIRQNLFSIEESDREVSFDFQRKEILTQCDAHFEEFIGKSGFNCNRVNQHTALIFLNIAALHHHPYNLLLFHLGKLMLWESLNSRGPSEVTEKRMVSR